SRRGETGPPPSPPKAWAVPAGQKTAPDPPGPGAAARRGRRHTPPGVVRWPRPLHPIVRPHKRQATVGLGACDASVKSNLTSGFASIAPLELVPRPLETHLHRRQGDIQDTDDLL